MSTTALLSSGMSLRMYSIRSAFRRSWQLLPTSQCRVTALYSIAVVTGVTSSRCASSCVVECWICKQEVSGSNLSLGNFALRSTQPSIPPGSVNEYQLRLGRQRQVWLIPIADERVGVQVKHCEIP